MSNLRIDNRFILDCDLPFLTLSALFLISYTSGFSLAALSLSMGILCMRFSGVILGRSKIVDSCYLVVFMSFSMLL